MAKTKRLLEEWAPTMLPERLDAGCWQYCYVCDDDRTVLVLPDSPDTFDKMAVRLNIRYCGSIMTHYDRSIIPFKVEKDRRGRYTDFKPADGPENGVLMFDGEKLVLLDRACISLRGRVAS